MWGTSRRRVLLAAVATIGCVESGSDGAGTVPPTESPPPEPAATDTGTAADGTVSPTGSGMQPEGFAVTSPAFDDGDPIPRRYGKAYDNVNPPLSVAGAPDATASLAVIVDDPDAGDQPFTHWLAWNVPPGTDAIPADWSPPDAVVQGTNDFGNVGYDGPRPPEQHRYRFRVVALDATLSVERGADRQAVTDAMAGHVLAVATLTGTFSPE